MSALYIFLFILIFDLSLAPYLSEIIFSLVPVPLGFQTFFIFSLTLLLAPWVLIFKKQKVFPSLLKIIALWMPWVIYLALRTKLSDNGIWKLEMYLVKVFFPCMMICGMYLANPVLFKKLFMGTFFWINAFMLPYLFLFLRTYGEMGVFERNIWLSRSLGISILYYTASFKFEKKYLLIGPLLLIFAVSMIIIGARGPVISLTLTLLLFSVIKFRKNVALLSILFTMGFGVIVLTVYTSSISKAVKDFSTHGEDQALSETVQGRTGVYLPTGTIIAKHPYIGVGLARWWDEYRESFLMKGSYHYNRFKITKNRDYTYPHNIILEILSELGTIGLFLFALLFWPFRRLATAGDKTNYLIFMGFLFAFTSSDITQNAAPMMFNILSQAAWFTAAHGPAGRKKHDTQAEKAKSTALTPCPI